MIKLLNKASLVQFNTNIIIKIYLNSTISRLNLQNRKMKFHTKKDALNIMRLQVREEGLEPSRRRGATPSRWCVYQFRHSRYYKKNFFRTDIPIHRDNPLKMVRLLMSSGPFPMECTN